MSAVRNFFTKRRTRLRQDRCSSAVKRRLRYESLEHRDLLAVTATLSLGSPAISGEVAHLAVSLDFAATAGEELAYFSLDVEPSSSSLVGPGPDYSAFTFAESSPLLDAWTQIGFFNDPGFESSVEYDDSLIASLPPGVYELGTLSVDFGAAGLSLSDSFTVAINGQGTVIGVEDTGQSFAFHPVNFNPASRLVTPVTLSGSATVSEGSLYTLTINASDNLVGSFVIDWGDGQQQTVTSQQLPANGEVTHTYLDGPLSPTIAVELLDQGGGTTPIGDLSLTVTNVVPDASLSGPASVAEGSLFVLTIGPVDDPGSDTVTQYVIDWGDGQRQTINAADLPLSRAVSHTYIDGPSSRTIVVDLVDEDGTHGTIVPLAVDVSDSAPDVSLSGPAAVAEGSPYTLTIGEVNDPGSDPVTQFVIHWGDGQQQTVNAADLSPSREVPHTYSDGPLSPTIVIDVVNDDGTFIAVDSLSVTVTNVTPVTSLSGPATTNEGSSYSLTIGAITDPGEDTVAQFVIHWGDGQQQSITSANLPGSRQVTHIYSDGPLSPTIQIDVLDEDGAHNAAASLAVTVADAPPSVSLSGPAIVDEGSPYVVTFGAVNDVGIDTVTQYVIRWGDGQTQTINAADLPASRQVTHTYSDGPLSPIIQIDLVNEDGTHPLAGSLPLTVANVPPSVSLSGAATVNEGSPYTLTISGVNDSGNDTITQYVIHWGDGQQQTILAADLPASSQVTHVYPDGPLSPTIVVDLVDEDGVHTSSASLLVTVTSGGPSVTLSGPDTVVEGSSYVLMIEGIDDPANDRVGQLTIDWGDGTLETINIEDFPADGQFTHTFGPGPTDVTIVVDLVDRNGIQLARFTQTIEVLDDTGDGFVLDSFLSTANIPGETDRPSTVVAIAEFTDLGTRDTHTATIDWGDGSPPVSVTVTQVDEVASVAATHEYPTGGVFTIELTITDDDGFATSRETKAYVTGFRVVSGVLQIVGSDENDIVTVTPERETHLFVSITIPGTGNVRRIFELAEVQGIDVYVGAGNDRVMVSERLTIATYMDGGPNDDHVQGGDGPNILLGGPGDDTVLGGADRDILFGGQGQNRLLGYGADDVMIGGVWGNADDQRIQTFATWSSEEPFSARQTRVSELLDVVSDATTDWLFGGTGENLYYASEADRIQDGSSHESHTIHEILALGWGLPHDRWEGVFTAIPNALNGTAVPATTEPSDVRLTGESEGFATSATDGSMLASSARDVNRDGYISPQDVIVIVNALNSDQGGQVTDRSGHLDANQDGWVTALDALGTINHLNALASSAEGESMLGIASMGAISATSSLGAVVDEVDQSLLAKQELEFGEPKQPMPTGDVGSTGSLDLIDPEDCSSANCDLEAILGDIAAEVASSF